MLNIIIPCYNNKDTLPDTLNSLLIQTKKIFMVTIIEDHGDQTQEITDIVNSYKNKLNINYIKNSRNLGPGLTRQVGIDANKMCDYLMFIDSDDILYPRAVEILYKEAKTHDADMVSSNIYVEGESHIGKILDKENNLTWMHGKIYKAKFLKDKEIRFPNYIRYNEDGYFNLKCNFLSKKKYFIEEVTYLWRNNKFSITREKNGLFCDSGTIDYIKGQLNAFYEILQEEDYSNLNLFNTLSIIYNYYIYYFLILNNEKNNDIENLLKQLFNSEKIEKLFIEGKCIGYISEKIKSFVVINNKIHFFPINFDRWAKNYNENICC